MSEQKGIVALQEFDKEQIEIIKSSVMPPNSTNMELAYFLQVCKGTGLNPFTRQIYAIKTKKGNVERLQAMTSIDGFRLIAERSKKYLGQTKTEWCGKDGIWKDVWLSSEFPVACRVGVLRKGFTEPCYAVALWAELVKKDFNYTTKQYEVAFMWKKMPAHMLAKCAEALALRKSFPQELSGLYTQDEMELSEIAEQSAQIELNKYKKPTDKTQTEAPKLENKKEIPPEPTEPVKPVTPAAPEVVTPEVEKTTEEVKSTGSKTMDKLFDTTRTDLGTPPEEITKQEEPLKIDSSIESI